MGKKIDKANEHIEILIDELVTDKYHNLGCKCPHYNEKVRPCENYGSECGCCKEEWKENLRKKLLKKYIVN